MEEENLFEDKEFLEKERAYNAYGAAARAVVAIIQGDAVKFVMVKSNPGDGWEITRLSVRKPESPRRSLEFAIRHLAAHFARGRGIGNTDDDPADYDDLFDLANKPNSEEIVGEDLVMALRFIEEAAQTGLWGDEEECFRQAYQAAQEALDEYWPQIRAIAVPVAAQGQLDGAEVIRIFDTT